MRFDEKLSRLLNSRNLKAPDIVRKHGDVSANTVRKWSTPQGDPSLSEIQWLAEFFGVPVAYLADDEIEALASPPALSPAQQAAVDIIAANDMDKDDVIRRLTRERAVPRAVKEADGSAGSGPGKTSRRRVN